MKRLFLVATLTSIAGAGTASEKPFLLTHKEGDSKFLTSIERFGPCTISTPAVTHVRVPWQLYPQKSVQNHEEGTVRMELIFDGDWCVRKATIVQSTGHWRLDEVSLSYMMTVKYMPNPEGIIVKDGESTLIVKIGWGASQGKK